MGQDSIYILLMSLQNRIIPLTNIDKNFKIVLL